MRDEMLDPSVKDTNTYPEAAEQDSRAGAYQLLGALLQRAPDAQTLGELALLEQQAEAGNDEFGVALRMLGLAARQRSPEQVDDEFHALFIGLGRGELVPYGSWYLTGYLMEKPLAELRDDLEQLGFERDPGVYEPEDHAAALCEVMSMLIGDRQPLRLQSTFHAAHLGSWMPRFFDDLSCSGSAVFYRAVGRLGATFIALEQQYLADL